MPAHTPHWPGRFVTVCSQKKGVLLGNRLEENARLPCGVSCTDNAWMATKLSQQTRHSPNAVSMLDQRRNFQPIEVVGRGSEIQPQMVENVDGGPILKQHWFLLGYNTI